MSDGGLITPNVRDAAALAHRIQLVGIQCLGLGAQIVAASAVDVRFVRHDVPKLVAQWFIQGQNLVAVLPFSMTIDAGPSATGPMTRYAQLTDVLKLDYQLILPLSADALAQIPHVVGISGYMHAWPYFRADVQMLTTRIGLPGLTLPVIVSGQVPALVDVAAVPAAIDPQPATPALTGST